MKSAKHYKVTLFFKFYFKAKAKLVLIQVHTWLKKGYLKTNLDLLSNAKLVEYKSNISYFLYNNQCSKNNFTQILLYFGT